MPPQVNATVIKVAGGGKPDDWDRAAEAGPDKWEGAVRVYYREATDRARDGAQVNIATRRELIVDVADLDLWGLDTDDLVTFRVDGRVADTTGLAKAVRRAELAGVPRELQTAKVTLEDA